MSVPFTPPAVALPAPVVLVALALGAVPAPTPGVVVPGVGEDWMGAVLKTRVPPGEGLTLRVLAAVLGLRMVPPASCCRERSC
jgi:hypothetical protein